MNKIILFCFPYAGGSALTFNRWKRYLDPSIELVPVELAGRGNRISERLYKDVQDVIEDVFQVIKHKIYLAPYALYGHSMGCLIAYELAQKIKALGLPAPHHAFFSGRRAPHMKRLHEKNYHLMNDEEFRKEVLQLGGTPPEFFDHSELMDLFLPALKNDFRIAETEGQEEIIPLDTDITVFLGKDEDLSPEQCDGWKKHTHQLCTIHYFNGGHFFLNQDTEKIVQIINRAMVREKAYKT